MKKEDYVAAIFQMSLNINIEDFPFLHESKQQQLIPEENLISFEWDSVDISRHVS